MLTFSLIASLQRVCHTVEFFGEYCNKFCLQTPTACGLTFLNADKPMFVGYIEESCI